MAGHFTDAEWQKITNELDESPANYGMPEGGREASLVFASFNIRKLGKTLHREREIDFLAGFCARCDLIAIQEVQDNLDGLRLLKDRMEAKVAGTNEFGLIVSDINGEVPGETGMAERLAFIYRKHRVQRMDMASDLNIDRSTVMQHFFDNHKLIVKTRKAFDKKMAEFDAGERSTKPVYAVPAFITFMRSPHVTAFEVPAANDEKSITFAAVNAHLIYGKQKERDAEFEALIKWLAHRLKSESRMTVNNFILMGDLNLNFDQPVKDRARIEKRIRLLNEEAFGNADERRIYFPLIDGEAKGGKAIRTNARHNQTFDQIAFFLGRNEKRLPNDRWRALAKDAKPDGFAYGVFNFTDLFARALNGEAYTRLSKAEKTALGKKFEHSVSDHMPIWVRLPRPGFAPPPQV